MKAQILSKLYLIKQCVEQTGFKGNLSLAYMGVSVSEWDEIIESITEYPRYKHNITVAEGVEVALLLN